MTEVDRSRARGSSHRHIGSQSKSHLSSIVGILSDDDQSGLAHGLHDSSFLAWLRSISNGCGFDDLLLRGGLSQGGFLRGIPSNQVYYEKVQSGADIFPMCRDGDFAVALRDLGQR